MKSVGFFNDITKCFTKRMFSLNIENSFFDKSLINGHCRTTVVFTLRKWLGTFCESGKWFGASALCW